MKCLLHHQNCTCDLDHLFLCNYMQKKKCIEAIFRFYIAWLNFCLLKHTSLLNDIGTFSFTNILHQHRIFSITHDCDFIQLCKHKISCYNPEPELFPLQGEELHCMIVRFLVNRYNGSQLPGSLSASVC